MLKKIEEQKPAIAAILVPLDVIKASIQRLCSVGLEEKEIPLQKSPASTSRPCVFSSSFAYDIIKIDVVAVKPCVTCDVDAPDVNAKEWREG